MDVLVSGNSLVINPDKSLQGKTIAEVLEYPLRLAPGYRKELFRAGRVKQGREILAPDDEVKAGHRVYLEGGVEDGVEPPGFAQPSEVQFHSTIGTMPPVVVLYEDEHLLVVNKPAPLLVYPGSSLDQDTLDARVAQYYQQSGLKRRVYHVHRLDRDTSGAILYAKHAYSARALDSLLAEHNIRRSYLALVRGRVVPATGTIDDPIGRDRHVAGRYRVSPTGKEAVTSYRTLGTCRVANEPVTLVECHLQTGRTHQIRVHMSARGCPVVGDRLYGGGEGIGSVRFRAGHALHAWKLTFGHPYTGQSVVAKAELPQEFQSALAALGLPGV